MSGESKGTCDFVEKCDSNRNGDISLIFDDGSILKTHSFILERASPIFKTILEDCNHEGFIQLNNVAKEVWIEILRELYPGSHTFFLTQTRGTYDEFLGRIAEEARKYDIRSLLQTLDAFICWRLQNTLATCSSDYDYRLTPFIQLSKDFELENSKQRTLDYITLLIKQNEETVRRNYENSKNNPIPLRIHIGVQPAVEIILGSGDVDWISKFSRGICNSVLRMDIRSCKN